MSADWGTQGPIGTYFPPMLGYGGIGPQLEAPGSTGTCTRPLRTVC